MGYEKELPEEKTLRLVREVIETACVEVDQADYVELLAVMIGGGIRRWNRSVSSERGFQEEFQQMVTEAGARAMKRALKSGDVEIEQAPAPSDLKTVH